MNEEIKEILHELDCHGVLNGKQDRDLLNYITKLQEEKQKLEKNYDRIYNENCKLREQHNITDISLLDENQKLKKLCNKYEEEHNSAFKLWTVKMEEMPDYEERMKLKQENEKLNKIIDGLENYLKVGIAMNFNMNNDKFSEQTVDNYNDILNKLTELKKRGGISEYN